jgi:alpha-glucosidase
MIDHPGSLLMAVSFLVLFCAAGSGLTRNEARVVSPDGSARFQVFLEGGRLCCAISFKDQPVVENSSMSFSLDGAAITEGVEFGEIETYQVKETYPWRGVHSQAVNHCNGARVGLRHEKSKTRYTLEIRALNDAVAFHTMVPGHEGSRVPDEATRFVLPDGCTVWYHDLEGHYEGVHEKKPVADIREGEWAAPPLTFKLPRGGGYASITEAALVNYSGMALQADGRRGFRLVLGHAHPVSYPFRLRYSEGDIERLSRPAAIPGTITSPWRVVLIGADLNALVNSDAIHNLCPAPDPKLFPKGMHTEWIKPGRAVWKYLDGGESTLEEMKEFCRLAGELGFEHHVVEGFWRRWSDPELKELVDCGRAHRVGIWLWRHSRDLRDPESRRAFLKKCHDLGVAGVKVDFFDHEAREVIDLYQVILREAAENRMMVNFHGSNKPAGEPRTWPNELVRESIKGMETRRLEDRARHDATLPFTRYLAGHADYTPVHFGERRGDTTVAHQVATAAVFTAPLLTYAAHPQKMLDSPCAPVLKSIPACWDETIVLPVSEIGEVAAFARRTGDTWFLAIVNGPAARTVRIPLTFLGEREYNVQVIRDDKGDPDAVQVEEIAAWRGDTLPIELCFGGGFIARFSRKS